MSVDTGISASEDLLGKYITDLQSNIVVSDGNVRGTLKYVTEYTGFSGDPAEQSGNYLALHFATVPDADSITVELINGSVGHPVTFDSDGICVFRISDKDTQYIEFVATKDDRTITKTLYLQGLVLEDS